VSLRQSAVWRRFRPLAWLAVVVLALGAATRLALLLQAGAPARLGPADLARAFGIGAAYDLVTALYLGLPLLLWLWLAPRRLQRHAAGRALQAALCFVLLAVLLFVAMAEWTFWEEFQTRFNFIAVDYLVYTTEVLGNIRESYPVPSMLAGLGAATVVLFAATRKAWRATADGATFAARSAVAGGLLALAALVTVMVSADLKDGSENAYVNELAGNGIYQFFAAYRAASLDYERFYQTLPLPEAFAALHALLSTPDATFTSADPLDIRREIHNPAPERRLNVVLISVESLSAWYSGTYGRPVTLTPELDKLSAQSLVFTRLYASGTRTVRGLEALALSVPPTPGESIVKRPGNEGLFSLAEVFNAKGYASQFLYGGYGAFDNMNQFFAANGYDVRDRAAIDAGTVHHANIWGVADEDLYTMALGEFDREHAAGRPFFAHVLTTSNHRPYTFPAGRVGGKQGDRHGAVEYTDWAIGDFLRRARTRPWFDDTVFVITADHCASSGGIANLPVFRYHIPLWIYSPRHVAPAVVDRMMAQIDIGPTVLGLLGMDYRSEFYGADLFQLPAGHERALIGNYQRLGYLRDDQLIQLAPHRQMEAVRPDYEQNNPQPRIALDHALAVEALGYYQTASYRFAHGLMRLHEGAAPAAEVPGG
jgi:phosphoglycerol transferase MdoB-like AlkP superfamily enzyme